MSLPESPSISVIVPTRDRPRLLERALESALSQAYPGELECLVVFDGTDPKLPSWEERPGRSVRALTNERSPGLAGARNTGIQAARGDYVAFLDDDDEWLQSKLGLQVEAMRRHSSRVASSGIYVSYRGRNLERMPSADTVSFSELLRSRRVDVHPSTFLIDRDALLQQIGLVDEKIPGSYAEDYDLILRAARTGVIATVREPLVRVLWHDSSFFTGRWDTIIDALTYLLRKHPEFASEPSGMSRIYGQIAFAHAASGRPQVARRWARRCLRHDPRQARAYLAVMVSLGLVRADDVRRLAHRFGRGI